MIFLTFSIGSFCYFFFLTFFSTSSTTLSIILALATFVCGIPDKYKRLLSFPPPVKPISVCAASPGPLTTHPIIERLIGSLI